MEFRVYCIWESRLNLLEILNPNVQQQIRIEHMESTVQKLKIKHQKSKLHLKTLEIFKF